MVVTFLGLGLFFPHKSYGLECNYAGNQMELTKCAADDFGAADKVLNARYRTAMALMKQTDRALDKDLKGAEKALRGAQRAWISYRDKACDTYGFLARGGSMESMLVLECRAALTAKRSNELQQLLDGFGN